MAIELDGIPFPRIHRMTTLEQTAFVYHHMPGQAGDVVQDLGRASVRLQIEGIFYGPKAKESLAALRDIYLKRTAVDFVADIVGGAYASKVTLDRLDVTQTAAAVEQFSYVLIITESIPPPEQTVNTALIDQQAELDAKAMLDLLVLPDTLSLGSMPEITNPFVPLKSALDPVQAATDDLVAAMDGLKELFGTG